MADIDVVPKRGTSAWVWILVALVVVALAWFLFARNPAPEGVGRWDAPVSVSPADQPTAAVRAAVLQAS